MGNSNDNRRYFSIAKEFDEVKKIVDNQPNASRFICEAILEKYYNQNTPVNTSGDEKLNKVLDKLGEVVNKAYNQRDLDELVEYKVKEVIQQIILANQTQIVLSGLLSSSQSIGINNTSEKNPQLLSNKQDDKKLHVDKIRKVEIQNEENSTLEEESNMSEEDKVRKEENRKEMNGKFDKW